MKDLAHRALFQLAVAEGATTPNPGFPAIAYSTTLAEPVRWNGTTWNRLRVRASLGRQFALRVSVPTF